MAGFPWVETHENSSDVKCKLKLKSKFRQKWDYPMATDTCLWVCKEGQRGQGRLQRLGASQPWRSQAWDSADLPCAGSLGQGDDALSTLLPAEGTCSSS